MPGQVILRRTGRRPLRFPGRTLRRTLYALSAPCAVGAEGGGILLGLHASDAGGFVCECGCLPPRGIARAQAIWPWFAAELAADRLAAARCFEALEPVLRSGPAGAPPLIRLAAEAGLRAAFAQAVGRFLHELARDAV